MKQLLFASPCIMVFNVNCFNEYRIIRNNVPATGAHEPARNIGFAIVDSMVEFNIDRKVHRRSVRRSILVLQALKDPIYDWRKGADQWSIRCLCTAAPGWVRIDDMVTVIYDQLTEDFSKP
jgi:hypothetical protein